MEQLNLEKGQKVDLTKTNPGLTKIIVAAGWDVNKSAGGKDFDLDVSAYLIDQSGKLTKSPDIVYFGAKEHPSGSVRLSGDNLTGQGEGDDELIYVDFARIPVNIIDVVFAINIYKAQERKQNFGMVSNAYIRVLDGDRPIMRYDLNEDYSTFTSVKAAKVYRKDGEWKFQAIGEGAHGTINDIAQSLSK